MSPPLSCSRTRSTPTPGGQGSYSSAHRPVDNLGEVRRVQCNKLGVVHLLGTVWGRRIGR